MSRTFQNKALARSCDSYISTIEQLRYKLETTEKQVEYLAASHKNEANFLRATILIALGLGFVIGVILSKGF